MSSDGHGLILVVDDDDSIREMICLLLEFEGYRSVGCRDGFEGLDAARRLCPSLITLDIQMPGMSGEEVLDRLKTDDVTARIPVVVVSAYPMSARIKVHQQVRSILRKPFDNDELLKTVAGITNIAAA